MSHLSAAGLASYALRSVVCLDIAIFLTATLSSNEGFFVRLELWLMASSVAVVMLALIGLFSGRSWKSKVIDLLFALPALALLVFLSLSSVPGL